LRREQTSAEAIALMNEWAGKPLPLSATCHIDNQLYVRLSGAVAAVRAARENSAARKSRRHGVLARSARTAARFFQAIPAAVRLSLKSTTRRSICRPAVARMGRRAAMA